MKLIVLYCLISLSGLASPKSAILLDSARQLRNVSPLSALQIAKQALRISIEERDSLLMSDSHRLVGLVQSDLGNNLAALENYEEALDIAIAIHYKDGIQKTYNNLGVIQFEMGKYRESLDSHYKSLRLKEETKDTLGISFSLNNLGLLHHRFKDFANAEKYFLKSIEIREKYSREDLLMQSYNNLACLYFDINSADKAAYYYDLSLKHNNKAKNVEMLSESYLGKAKLAEKLKNHDSAYFYVNKSVAVAKKAGLKDELAASYNLMGNILLEKNDLGRALAYADSSGQLIPLIYDRHLIGENKFLLAKIFSAKNEFESAYHYLVEANESKEEEYSLAVANNLYNSNLRMLGKDQETQLLIKDMQIDRREKAIIVLIIGGIFLGAFTFFVTALYRYTSRLNKSLKLEKEKLKRKRDQLSEYSRKLKSLVESKSESIYHKNMQLAGYAFLNAHKMRSPITTLLGLIQLNQKEKQADQTRWLNEIRKNVIRLDRISKHINQILAEEMDLINDDKMKKYFDNFKEILENFKEQEKKVNTLE